MLLGAALSFIAKSAVVNSNAIMVVVYDAKTRTDVFQFQCMQSAALQLYSPGHAGPGWDSVSH